MKIKLKDTVKMTIETILSRNRPILTLFLLLALFASCENSHAQNTKDKSVKAYKIPSNLKQHVLDKHKKKSDWIDKDSFMSDLQETANGPKGSISFHGRLSSYSSEAGSGDPATRARSIANAFLKDEAELFGLLDLSELHELRFSTSKGFGGDYTHIYYTRFVGDWQLENSLIYITIGPDEAIRSVRAALIPAPVELYRATANKTISEEETRQIIGKDARTKNAPVKEFKTREIELYAIPSLPYAVWKGDVIMSGGRLWKYELSAFSGEIINVQKLLLGERE